MPDFDNGTVTIHMPDDENIWLVSFKNFRYETIELSVDAVNYLVSAANVLIDYIEKHGKFYGDIDKLSED